MPSKPAADMRVPFRIAQSSFLSLADPPDVRRVEYVVAVARVLVSVGVIETAQFARIEPSQPSDLTSALIAAYSGFVLLFLMVLPRHQTVPRRLPIFMQIIDICFAVVLTSEYGLNGPLLLALLFPLLVAGYRWGFREVIITAAVLGALLAAENIAINLSLGPSLGAALEQFDVNGFATRGAFVVIAGAVVGYLAENEHRRRSEAVAVSGVVAQARPGAEFKETLNLVLGSIRDVFGAKTVLLVLRETQTGSVFRWATDASAAMEPVTAIEIPPAARGDYLFAAPGVAWHAVPRKLWRRGRSQIIAIDKLGRRLPSADVVLPEGFVTAHRCRRVLCVSLTLSEEWTGRVFVLEPALGIHRDQSARFALRLATQAGSVLYGHYLVHRVRVRAQVIERGRIARELHDGITQSLLGLEMQIAAVRRRAIAEAPQIDEDLARIHDVLRNEVISVRELMEGIRAGSGASEDLVEELAEMVDRFQRYTGIAAKFESGQAPIGVSAHTRRQIARILHEALVNVRKHSGARRVLVRAAPENGRWRLSIEDDGRGFPFAGLRSHAELDALRQGPRMIGERVRMIGGEMIVESRPMLGARVEVAIPLQPQSS